MAVPTLDQLHEFISELIDRRQPEGQFAVFEHEFLAANAWRHFRTTSPAIRTRINTLIEEGRLKPVNISNTGHVYPDDEELSRGLFTLYFQYHNPSGYGHDPENYGFVTAKRIEKHDNVWRSGYRNLYTTADQRDAMIAHFKEVRAKRAEKAKTKREQEEARMWELLEAASPGARQVLDDLRSRIDNDGPRSEVEPRLTQRLDGEERLSLSVDTRGTANTAILIDIIRRGLAASKEAQ